jgi:hypothetical protein
MKYAAPISNSLIAEKQLVVAIVWDKQCDALCGSGESHVTERSHGNKVYYFIYVSINAMHM